MNLLSAIILNSFFFRQPYCANSGVGEDDSRNSGVIHLGICLAVKEALRQGTSSLDCYWRQLFFARHIAQGIDARYDSVLVLIHSDKATVIQGNSCSIKIEPLDIWLAANSPDDPIGNMATAVLEVEL